MKAIDKAWNINLNLPKSMRFEHKEDLICEQCIFDDEYKIHIKEIDDDKVCEHFNEYCTECWNSEAEDNESEKLMKEKYDMKKVFLGGTCAKTVWREKLIKMLEIDYFNPVVEDWTEECMKEERIQRETCDYCLYVITPSTQGVYSIAEVVDDSNKRPEKTIFCVLKHEIPCRYEIGSDGKTPFEIYPSNKREFNESEMKSLNQVGEMVKRNGGVYVDSLEKVAYFLNKQK